MEGRHQIAAIQLQRLGLGTGIKQRIELFDIHPERVCGDSYLLLATTLDRSFR